MFGEWKRTDVIHVARTITGRERRMNKMGSRHGLVNYLSFAMDPGQPLNQKSVSIKECHMVNKSVQSLITRNVKRNVWIGSPFQKNLFGPCETN